MTRSVVASSNIVSVGYDADRKLLEVEFKVPEGKPPSVYLYEGVAPRVYAMLMRPDVSIGKMFHALVKRDPRVTARKVEVAPSCS